MSDLSVASISIELNAIQKMYFLFGTFSFSIENTLMLVLMLILTYNDKLNEPSEADI